MTDPLDLLLRALADGTRRALLDRLRDRPGLTLSALLEGFAQSRQALSKHLAMLEDAELVVPVWRGREKLHYLNPAPLQALPARWVTASEREEQAAAQALRDAVVVTPDGGGTRPRAPRTLPHAPSDPIARLLLVPPASLLQGQPVLNGAALVAVREYLGATADAVQALLAALPADGGYDKPVDNGFSLVEHLWHLSDIETLGWLPRFTRMLDETRPSMPGVDGDQLALEKQYQSRPWRAAARHFVSQRRRSLQLLARYDDDVLRRPVVFAGTRTRAGGVLAAAVAHDLDHRPQMAERWTTLQANREP